MALQINNNCLSCGACVAECPHEAIAEQGPMYVIKPDLCTECVVYDEPQCVNVCPADAIVPNPNHQETHEDLL